MTAPDRDLNDRDTLIGMGILPGPGEVGCAMSIGHSVENPLIEEYRLMADRLAGRVMDALAQRDVSDDQIRIIRDDRTRAVRALNWLREVHKFDDLALEVIGYAINGPVGPLW